MVFGPQVIQKISTLSGLPVRFRFSIFVRQPTHTPEVHAYDFNPIH